MKILIDNGHGENTPGKRSPDGTFREYAYTREIADEVVRELAKRGYVAERIVKESLDVPLAERARRVNEVCARYGANNVLLVSIHCNAAGSGEWMNARGWSAYTTKGKTKADELANRMYDAAACFITGQKIRRDYSDGDPDWEENFYILEGEVDIVVDGVVNHLRPGQMIHIEPGEIHYVVNNSGAPMKMISTLAPYTNPDKVDVENYTY